MQADGLIKDEAQFVRVAMGHEGESLDEFVEAHKTTLNDIMYFPTGMLMASQVLLETWKS